MIGNCSEKPDVAGNSEGRGLLDRRNDSVKTRRRLETREILLKADKVSVSFERLDGGKIRVGTSSWDDPKVILANQVLEVASIGKQFGLVRVDKPIAYLDIDDTGLVEAGYGPEA